jgi:hypothetical protein
MIFMTLKWKEKIRECRWELFFIFFHCREGEMSTFFKAGLSCLNAE